jgi:hypothetical protein
VLEVAQVAQVAHVRQVRLLRQGSERNQAMAVSTLAGQQAEAPSLKRQAAAVLHDHDDVATGPASRPQRPLPLRSSEQRLPLLRRLQRHGRQHRGPAPVA